MPESWFELGYTLLWTGVFFALLARTNWHHNTGLSNPQLRLLFLAKVAAGVGFAVFYQIYYGSRETTDAFRFFDDALIIFSQVTQNPLVYAKIVLGIDMNSPEVVPVIDQLSNWYKQHHHGVFNDNQTIIRFNALVLLISQGHYHVHTVFINFLSFSGLIALIRAISSLVKSNRWLSLIIILFPQIVMWTSGVLKEGLIFCFMGWFFWYLSKLLTNGWNRWDFLGAFIFLLAMSQIKSYVLLCLIPGLTVLIASKFVESFKRPSVAILTIFVELLMVISVDIARGGERAAFIFQKQYDFINMAITQKAGSYFESFILEPSWGSILANAPWAFYNTLTRPLFFDSASIISLMASFENLFILVIILLPVLFFRKPKTDQWPFVVFAISFWVLLWTLSGLVTPVTGALIRYKIPALPFLFSLVFLLTDWKRFFARLGKH